MRHNPTNSRLKAYVVAPALAACALVFLGAPAARAAGSTVPLLTWTKLAPATAPSPRENAAMAYDAANGTTVLFGGQSGSLMLGDTWTWDGATWTQQSPALSPPPLQSASMAYDNIGHRLILFGGAGTTGTATNATWAWDGSTWTALAPTTSPPARYGAAIASDAATGSDVLFGGLSAPGAPLGDTWSWNGTNWVAGPAAPAPTPRSGAAMTFDATRGVVVLFGGNTGAANEADTWTWDGTVWAQQTPAMSPPARSDAGFGFDPGSDDSVLFGGTGNGTPGAALGSSTASSTPVGSTPGVSVLGDTWLWNGTTWATSVPLTLVPDLNPPSRTGLSVASAPGNQRLILFGGESGGANPGTLADTWSVSSLATLSPSPSTTAGASSTSTSGSSTSTTTAGTSTSSSTIAPARVKASVPRSPLALASRSVRRGDDVRVSGSGFAPHSKIVITLHSVTMVVGTTYADALGRFSDTVVVPTDTPTGSHHIEAAGPAKAGGQAVLVAQVSVTAPGASSDWLLAGAMVALTILLAAGAGLVLTASTRWHSSS